MTNWMRLGLCTIALSSSLFAAAQSLDLRTIMQGEDFVGYSPENIRWSNDSKTIYFSWNPNREPLRSTFAYDRNTGGIDSVRLAELRTLNTADEGVYNADFTAKVFAQNGDLFYLDLTSGQRRAITLTAASERDPQFSGDGQRVIYRVEDNLMAWHIATGTTQQLTFYEKGKPRPEPKLDAHKQWLQDDQMAQFEELRLEKARRDLSDIRRKAMLPIRPATYYYGNKSMSNQQLDPTGRFVTFRLTQSPDERRTKVPDFVTESGYLNDLYSRAKVGDAQATYEMGITDLERDTTYLLDVKQLPGIYDKPAYLREYHDGAAPYVDTFAQPRSVIVHGPIYHESGAALLDIRSWDNKDRWIATLDPTNGRLDVIDHQRDTAWIGGPGISGWNYYPGTLGWLNAHTCYFQSERTGYSHLYAFDLRSRRLTPLTSGNYEVLSVQLSRDKSTFYLTTNAVSPHEQHFYSLSANVKAIASGKATPQQLTSGKGAHEVALSPDEQWLAIRYSNSNTPWELYLQRNQKGAKAQQLTQSTTAAFAAYQWRKPEIVRFTARDGAQVPARLYRPAPDQRNGAAVIFVHGAGYLQNVHEWWSSYYREYMFHHLLTDAGYTVLDIDYRASAGYGRDWRTAIYRHMGGMDLSDQVDGARFLVDSLDIDAHRMGIYGGSYGGFITLMALFNAPETFKVGAALRSVTDWAHYNHPYTSNILNTPASDSLAYRRSSPLYFAEGLQGDLLIAHGMVDTNVQFQDVVRLSQRLIELGKTNWEMAVFPMEGHGFRTATSWADEYRRIFELFERTLRE